MSKVESQKNFEGKMIVVTAPSGAGKTTIVKHLLDRYTVLDFSISATTRDRRPKEKHGRDYYFMSVEEFKAQRRKRKFVEWEEVYEDQFYGTLKSEVQRIWDEGKHIIFDIDVRGAHSIKKKYGDRCLAIFIKPPNVDTLIDRLTKRKTESPESLRKRIRKVKRELKHHDRFDRLLINDLLEVALEEAEIMVEDFLKIK